MTTDLADSILRTYLHVQDDSRIASIQAPDSFWPDLAAGALPELDLGRLMSAFTFTGAWDTWERHPSGEEVVMLLTGAVTLVLEEPGGARSVQLNSPGSYVLIPPNIWHTATADVESTLVFLTPGAGTEHRPMRTQAAILDDIAAFVPADGEWLPLESLLGELWSTGPTQQALAVLFCVFERFPDEDGAGVLWSIVHGVEGLPFSYSTQLAASLARAPSLMGNIMQRRLNHQGC